MLYDNLITDEFLQLTFLCVRGRGRWVIREHYPTPGDQDFPSGLKKQGAHFRVLFSLLSQTEIPAKQLGQMEMCPAHHREFARACRLI